MDYSREELMTAVSGQMPIKRWEHTEGVMAAAVQLANKYGGDPVKADLAALLHDVAKYWPIQEQQAVVRNHPLLDQDLLNHDKQLLHSEVGYFVARSDYGVSDIEVLDAIRYHTSGRIGMTLMDKIICLADYIEPGRDFPGVDYIREQANQSLEEGLIAGFDSTIRFLLDKKKVIYPLTILARNDLVGQMKSASTKDSSIT
ncbi:putative HD superfamily hydrolase involved in NAD metabolism [Paenibacillus shirakamiensis]|uniref:bis(5'-nucleosyl)-tetraphosphatase (symmetrical) n=1 Tax=Paenibacillus shirakamiensis TaxID=1265935 RepID=A0ABS4JBP3_9BACL|nr:bis(5'-nucleosyl)-tetraphosphatase (symmetrical) YqeK [Paenibacillus shirakamiensis]MBP1999118.1 putative HD superfamily hydrolase involved in NAD metabolism [Paenibacillus shirakamiensis]